MLIERRRPNLIRGMIIVLTLGVISWFLAGVVPQLGSVTVAILLGVLIGNILPLGTAGRIGAGVAEKRILPVAIVLLGVELQLATLASLGLGASLIILTSIVVAIIASVLLGRAFGFSREFSLLIGAGNGICGSSAVAATSMTIDASESDTGISIGVVNLLGTIGIFTMPLLINLLALTDFQGGLLVGGTLQAFGQVVAAGYTVNDDVGNIATVVKMGRVLMLGPVVVLIGSWFHARVARAGKSKARVRIPRFIFGFFLLSVLASTGLITEPYLDLINRAGKLLLVVAMAGIGMRIQFKTLFQSGVSALLFGGAVAVIQSIVVLLLVFLI